MIQILHIDDDPDQLELTNFRMSDIAEDFEIVGVTTAEEALELLRD